MPQEGNAGYEEEHQAFALEFLFDEFERGERLARAAGHDEFTAVVQKEVLVRGFEGFTLVLAELFLFRQGGLAFQPFEDLAPIDG